MTEVKTVGELEVSQNLRYQNRMWRVQRFAWLAFFIILALVALGLAGGLGPLNEEITANDRVRVEYEPFARRIAPTEMEVTAIRQDGGQVYILVERDFLSEYGILGIVPEPQSVSTDGEFIVFEFIPASASDGLTASFSLEPEATTVGSISGRVGPPGGPFVNINQFVYP